MWQVRCSLLTQIRYGNPETILENLGRGSLEQSLEHFFSKWVWQWDVERQKSSPLYASAPTPAHVGIMAEASPALESCNGISTLEKSFSWFADASASIPNAPVDTILLRDDQVLWPQAHSDEAMHGRLRAQERNKIAMYVLEHLVGLDKERADDDKARSKVRAAEHSDESGFFPNPFPNVESVSDFFSGGSAWLGLNRIWSSGKSIENQQTEVKISHAGAVLSKLGAGDSSASPCNTKGERQLFRDMDAGSESVNCRTTNSDKPAKADPKQYENALDSSLSSLQSEELARSLDALKPSEPVHEPSTSEDRSTEIPFAVRIREPAKLFTTNAPFQNLHEQLSQALDENEPESSESFSPVEPQDAMQKYGACVTTNQLNAPSKSLQDMARAESTNKPAPHTEHSCDTILPPTVSTPTRRQHEKTFPPLSTSRAAWYSSPSRSEPKSSRFTHDPALDGWGEETPSAWHCAYLHLARSENSPVYVAYTTVSSLLMQRKLLTIIQIWKEKPADPDAWLKVSWELLRRSQRAVNDALLRAPQKSLDYLHMDDRSALTINDLSLIRSAPNEVRAGVEAQLLAAENMVQKWVLSIANSVIMSKKL